MGNAPSTQLLNPDVLIMKPAEDWNRCDTAGLQRTAKIWGILHLGRHSSATPSLPRRPAITIRTFSSAEYCRRVARG